MQYALWVAGVCAALVAAWFVLVREPSVANYPSSGTDIVALGDSLVYGTGATPGNGFVSRLSQQVGQPIINLGVPGDTTADVLGCLQKLDAYNPKVVIVLVGGNDYLRRISDDTVFANLAKIIENIQDRGAIVLLVGIRGGIVGDPYASRFKEVSNAYHTAYVPNALMGLFGDKRYMADQVHPNDAGYAKLAERIAPVLEDLLQ